MKWNELTEEQKNTTIGMLREIAYATGDGVLYDPRRTESYKEHGGNLAPWLRAAASELENPTWVEEENDPTVISVLVNFGQLSLTISPGYRAKFTSIVISGEPVR